MGLDHDQQIATVNTIVDGQSPTVNSGSFCYVNLRISRPINTANMALIDDTYGARSRHVLDSNTVIV